MQIFFCFSAHISIYFGHILFLPHAFATLISFLQETKFFPCHPDWALVYIPESTVSNSSVGYLYESVNPIVEHEHVSQGKLKGPGLYIFPLYVKNVAQSPFKKEIERFKREQKKKKLSNENAKAR